jgi:hypothetical protein
MKISDHFILQEFVPQDVFVRYGNMSTRFIDKRIVDIAEFLRDYFGGFPLTINNWVWDGQYNYSGFRPPNCDIGASMSSHKRGTAIDIKIKGINPLYIQDTIKDNQNTFLDAGITSIEYGTPTWTHVSCEWMNRDNLHVFDIRKEKT